MAHHNTRDIRRRHDSCMTYVGNMTHVNAHHLQCPPQHAQECKEALELRSNNTRALLRRAEAYLELGDLERAQNDVARGLEVEPESAPLLRMKARVCEQQKVQHWNATCSIRCAVCDVYCRM